MGEYTGKQENCSGPTGETAGPPKRGPGKMAQCGGSGTRVELGSCPGGQRDLRKSAEQQAGNFGIESKEGVSVQRPELELGMEWVVLGNILDNQGHGPKSQIHLKANSSFRGI